jgi:hypothetical protein
MLHTASSSLAVDLMTTQSVWLTATEAAQHLSVEPRTSYYGPDKGRSRPIRYPAPDATFGDSNDLDAMLTAPSVALTNGRIQ